MGQEIPIRVEDDGDQTFESGEAVLFYGRGVDSLFLDGLTPTRKYTESSVFWLTYGAQPGADPPRRMAQRDGSGAGTASTAYPTANTSSGSTFICRTSLSSTTQITGLPTRSTHPKNGSASQSYDFAVRNLPAGSYTARLRTRLLGLPGQGAPSASLCQQYTGGGGFHVLEWLQPL